MSFTRLKYQKSKFTSNQYEQYPQYNSKTLNCINEMEIAMMQEQEIKDWLHPCCRMLLLSAYLSKSISSLQKLYILDDYH